MLNQKRIAVVAMSLFCWCIAAVVQAQAFRIVDGEINLVGEFTELSSLHVTSRDGLLSLGTEALVVDSQEPFSREDGAVCSKHAQRCRARRVRC